MNDSAEGGAWLSGPGRGLPGRARARERVHDAHGHTARTPDGARPGGDGGFGFRPGRAGDLDTLDYSAFFRGLWRRTFLFMAIAILASSVAAAILVRLPPQYVAHALIVIGESSVLKPAGREKANLPARNRPHYRKQ